MSRPCFALSVMLCCMGGPLLIIGTSHAQDTAVSPSHDPGECIVCPLAHGPLEPCGGYSDYDYNCYWYDDYSPPASEATPPADPEFEVAQSPSDGATEEAWESDYEDYYADYVYGDDTAGTETEDLTLDGPPTPAVLVDSPSKPVEPPSEESSERYDEYGWFTDDSGDYFDSDDDYEPIESAEPAASSIDESVPADAAIDYEAYEEEWFSYGEDTTVDAPQVNPDADEAYEALSESACEAYSDEILDAQSAEIQSAEEPWGDEEAWYCEKYGYDGEIDDEVDEAIPALDLEEQLATGYDEAYDLAMATDLEAAEPAADSVPENPSAESTEADDNESFYNAYDDLFNFESTPAESVEAAESLESETSEAVVEREVAEPVQSAMDVEPAWLTALVDRMLAPIWTTADGTAWKALIPVGDSGGTIYQDECAQQWDCESDYWGQPQPEQPSVVLSAADTLDGMAAVLQNAAEYLRGVAGGHLAETARAADGESPR